MESLLQRVLFSSDVLSGLARWLSGKEPPASEGDTGLRVPLRSQGYCGVGRGLSGLHWVWCNGRGIGGLEFSVAPSLLTSREERGVETESTMAND